MIKFFQTREEAIEYALKISRERKAEEMRELFSVYIKLAIEGGLVGVN